MFVAISSICTTIHYNIITWLHSAK